MFDVFYIGSKPNLFVHEREVESIEQAQQLSRTRYFWIVNYLCDYTGWDFLWEPVCWEAHQRHAWASQHQPDSETYLIPKTGYTDTNYHCNSVINRLPNKDNWYIPAYIDSTSIDFSWHPNPLDPAYTYHFPDQHQSSSGVTYTVPGATKIKLHDAFVVKSLPNKDNWYIPAYIDSTSIDFSWHPNPLDPVCNYHFETKWHWNKVGGPEYRMSNTTDIKYLDSIIADTISSAENWHIPEWIDPSSIDYTWVPDPTAPPYIYEFRVEWGWNNIGGPEYHVPGATERKYVDFFVAKTKPDPTNFIISDTISDSDNVLRWRPNPTELPYIYVFGNQWYPPEVMESARYVVPGATIIKYVDDVTTNRLPDATNFIKLVDCDFDYSWCPDPGDPPYIYVFGNQHWSPEIMPTVEYHAPGATERKFVSEITASLPVQKSDNWHTLVDCNFDYSWVPDPGDPPYIYVFGNQWHDAITMPTVEYHVPGATERKFVESPIATLPQDASRWAVPEEVKADSIDYSWVPDPGSPPYIYHFGTEYQSSVGLTYTVPGASELKFAGDIPTVNRAPVVTVLDIFFIDRSNATSAERYARLQEKYPNIQKVRYVSSLLDTIKRCVAKTKTTKFWVVGSENVYDDFDFAWHAEPWQSYMTHVFGSQWNKWSDTFLINKYEFERHARWAKGIEEFPNLNFVTDQKVHAPADAVDIYVVDHGNADWSYLTAKYRVVKSARYFDNYLDTLKRIIKDVSDEHIWVVSSLCNYTRFDFSWQPEAWQRDMLHVFPSNEQKFGDTFYVPVKKLQEEINQLELLDWFETVNYCNDQVVERLPIPVVKHNFDTHVQALKTAEWNGPLAVLTVSNDKVKVPTVSLWRDKTKTITPLSAGASSIVMPKSAVPYIKKQLYDYPYIDKTHASGIDAPLDIVFISNGESCAEHNLWVLKSSLGDHPKNKLHVVENVNGRAAAYHAAARASTTPWFFAVFAKLEVDWYFPWEWQPDRMQEPKHYIFHAHNEVNRLEYGHQAMIAYNKELVLNNPGVGLDFTLDSAHEVVPILSGIARYCSTPWIAWRTAFREVLKLRASLPDVESEYRIKAWCTPRDPKHAVIINQEWSHIGALDALDYYEEVNGDFDALKKSYEWDWLTSYAMLKRNLLPE